MIRTGDLVQVTSAGGSIVATVKRCCKPEEVRELPIPASMLTDQGVDQVAMLRYEHPEHGPLAFAAVHLFGRWETCLLYTSPSPRD